LLGRCRAPSPLRRGAGSLWVTSVSEWGGGGTVWAKRNGRRRGVLALYDRGDARCARAERRGGSGSAASALAGDGGVGLVGGVGGGFGG
jgi:hypothetical protein